MCGKSATQDVRIYGVSNDNNQMIFTQELKAACNIELQPYGGLLCWCTWNERKSGDKWWIDFKDDKVNHLKFVDCLLEATSWVLDIIRPYQHDNSYTSDHTKYITNSRK